MMNHQIKTVEEAQTYIASIVDALPEHYRMLARAAMNLPGYWTVPSASGTHGNHHTMDGGNAIHTAQVLQIALDMLRSIPHAKTYETIVAVVWHDAMKIEDYEGEFWSSTLSREWDGFHYKFPRNESIVSALIEDQDNLSLGEMQEKYKEYRLGPVADFPITAPTLDGIYPQDEDGKRKTTRTYKLIRHLANSAMEFRVMYRDLFYETDIDDTLIEHIILSHHGRKEWGSPVEPQTVEAWAVHAADMMSSQFCVIPVENVEPA